VAEITTKEVVPITTLVFADYQVIITRSEDYSQKFYKMARKYNTEVSIKKQKSWHPKESHK
jgi:hypothetical protein